MRQDAHTLRQTQAVPSLASPAPDAQPSDDLRPDARELSLVTSRRTKLRLVTSRRSELRPVASDAITRHHLRLMQLLAIICI